MALEIGQEAGAEHDENGCRDAAGNRRPHGLEQNVLLHEVFVVTGLPRC